VAQRVSRQEQIEVGEAGANHYSGRTKTEPLHFAADRSTIGLGGTVDVVMVPGFADIKSYAVAVSYDGTTGAIDLSVTYTDGQRFTVAGTANRNVRWIAVGVSAAS
jgi:hypothetical protein